MRPIYKELIIASISGCTGMIAGIVIAGIRLASYGTLIPSVECNDTPLACARRTAENQCGGPGTYKVLNEEPENKRFTYVCIDPVEGHVSKLPAA